MLRRNGRKSFRSLKPIAYYLSWGKEAHQSSSNSKELWFHVVNMLPQLFDLAVVPCSQHVAAAF